MSQNDKNGQRVMHLRRLLEKLRYEIRFNIYTTDTKTNTETLAFLIKMIGVEGVAICGTQLWDDANRALQHLVQLGYLNGSHPSDKKTPHLLLTQKRHPTFGWSDSKTKQLRRRKKKKKNKTKSSVSKRSFLIFTGGFENSRRRH
jgi:hypothetical protein